MTGVEVRVVDFSGKDRFKPQSPLARDDGVVSNAACVGYGRVAVSESNRCDAVRVPLGRGSGGGNENSREFLRRLPVGDNCLVAIPRPGRLEIANIHAYQARLLRLRVWTRPGDPALVLVAVSTRSIFGIFSARPSRN